MAYSALPTRTSSDPNSAADVNTLQSNISTVAGAVYSITSNYTITDSDDYGCIIVNSSSGTVTVTLPTLADNSDREITIIHETSGNEIVIDGEGAETIDGLTTVNLPEVEDRIRIKAIASEWRIIDERISCQFRVDTHAGFGSTDTKIPRFTNVRDNYGNLFSENHSTGYNGNADGLEITINRAGKYYFQFSGGSDAASGSFLGISLNSSQLTTDVGSINASDRLCIDTTPINNNWASMSWSGYLDANDIIRPHTEGDTPATAARSTFIATYLGN